MTDARLLLVAHGSRDPRPDQALRDLVRRVRARRASLDVRLCYLELCMPLLERALEESSGRETVVVPLLLGTGYHARTDIPGRIGLWAAAESASAAEPGRLVVGEPIGTHAGLLRTLLGEAAALRSAMPDVDGYLLIGAGSSHPGGGQTLAGIAPQVEDAVGRPVRTCFVTRQPSPGAAARVMSDMGCRRLQSLVWLLVPGTLHDRARQQSAAIGARHMSRPLALAPGLPDLVLDRYDTARLASCSVSESCPRTRDSQPAAARF